MNGWVQGLPIALIVYFYCTLLAAVYTFLDVAREEEFKQYYRETLPKQRFWFWCMCVYHALLEGIKWPVRVVESVREIRQQRRDFWRSHAEFQAQIRRSEAARVHLMQRLRSRRSFRA